MNALCECPHCHADLRGPVIPVGSRHLYGHTGTKCAHGCGDEPHYSRLIGIYDQARDRTVAWQCPDCGDQWER